MDNKRFTHPKLIKQDRDLKYRLEEKNAQRRNDRNKILEKNRQITASAASIKPGSTNAVSNSKLNGTYTLPEAEKGVNRRKLLDLWRKERDQKMREEKPVHKPVFKVFHVDQKTLDARNKPCLCQSLQASRSNLNATGSTTANNNTFPNNLRTGPLTRSISRKINQTVETVKTLASNIKTFADQAKVASKFTFSALLVKKTKKPEPTPKLPLTKQTYRAPPPVTKNQPAKKVTTNVAKDEFLVVSSNSMHPTLTKPLIPSSSSSNSITSMQYEDFCGELFKKNVTEDDEFTYEAAKFQIPAAPVATPGKKSKSSRSSYRKSRSGMYKVDIQSSILELDDVDHRVNDVDTPTATETDLKLETIVENVAQINLSVHEPVVILQSNVVEIVAKEQDVEIKVEAEIVEEIKMESNKEEEAAEEEDFFMLDGEKRNVKFYRELVVTETRLLNECSAKWDNCIDEAPEDVQGDIRSSIGLAKLLIDERFTQFIELVDQSEFKTSELPVKCSDLQGFWEMVDYQVQDVKKKFGGLEKLKANNYVEEVIQPVKRTTVTKAAAPKKTTITAAAAAKKSKFAEFRAQQMAKSKQTSQDDASTVPDTVKPESPEQNKENTVTIATAAHITPNVVAVKKLSTPAVLMEKLSNTPKQVVTPLKSIEANTSAVHLKSIDKNIVFHYNTRSRGSDLIKFDNTPKNKPQSKSSKFIIPSIAQPPKPTMYNSDDDDDDDFLGLKTMKPISWRNSVANQNDIHIDLAASVNINLNLIGSGATPRTPSTPKNRKSIFAQANCATGGGDITKSPLLKLMFVSSHGKRLSRSGLI